MDDLVLDVVTNIKLSGLSVLPAILLNLLVTFVVFLRRDNSHLSRAPSQWAYCSAGFLPARTSTDGTVISTWSPSVDLVLSKYTSAPHKLPTTERGSPPPHC